MNKKIIPIKNCILGYGYAALIAYHKLTKNHNHNQILILQNNKAKPIFTIEHEGFHFSPLPIFPVGESDLYNSNLFEGLPKQKPITVSFSELRNFDYSTFKSKKGSLADYMVKAQGIDKNLCLGVKQWGEEMFKTPFSHVQYKIERHYVAPKGNSRIGYLNGQSLLKSAVENFSPQLLKYEKIEKIVLNKKEIHIEDSILRYDHLISTIPLHYLMDLCKLGHDHDRSYAGCHFYYFNFEGDFSENQMVYDCDYESDIIRIFSISNGFLMAQLNGDKRSNTDILKIEKRIKELAPNITKLLYARELFVPMCYPLERIKDSITLDSLFKLKSNGVIPFGRFGNWEYSDLHELNWTQIESL